MRSFIEPNFLHVIPLYEFQGSSSGAWPAAGLVGTIDHLYGVTSRGGNSACGGTPPGCGIVYELVKTGGTYALHVIHTFNYRDGAQPISPLIEQNGVFFGTSETGGRHSYGNVFEVTPGGRLHVLWNFRGGISGDGAYPPEGRLAVDATGALFGVTSQGGSYGQGAVFKIRPSASSTGYSETILHSFNGSDGAEPWGGLTLIGNALFGTTILGGPKGGEGVAFRIARDGKGFSLLHVFTGGSDGASPNAPLSADANGNLYGETQDGGMGPCAYTSWPTGCGTVFALSKSGKTYTESVLHAFTGGTDGIVPYTGVVLYSGMLYGVTIHGGSSTICGGGTGCGVVFRLSPNGSDYNVVHRFSPPADGGIPDAAVSVNSGKLLGTTSDGGTNGYGMVFLIKNR